LAIADYSLITPIFASAREKQEDYPVTSQDLERAAKEGGFEHIAAYSDNQSVLQHLSQIMQRGDVIMMMGAGDIHKMKSDIIRLMQSVK
jgi:UDP-N-acetylmuramate-alanine ligase